MVAAAFRSIFALTDPDRDRDTAGTRSPTSSTAMASPRPLASMRSARTDVLAFASVPPSALAQDLVQQPPGAAQQRDQTPVQRGRDLSQRCSPSSASSAPCWPTNTTNGPSLAATSPKTSMDLLDQTRDTDPVTPEHRRVNTPSITPRNPTTPRDAARGCCRRACDYEVVRRREGPATRPRDPHRSDGQAGR